MLEGLRAYRAPPPVFGFGISRPDQVEAALAAGAEGVICGSAIVERIAGGGIDRLAGFIEEMKAATFRKPVLGEAESIF